MGEIAEMMLNGDLDCETGEWIGEGFGFPRTMNRRRAKIDNRDRAYLDAKGQPIAKAQIARLKDAARDTGGMYPGVPWEHAPALFDKLCKRGLITSFEPHNPAHKTRAVPTEAGLALLLPPPPGKDAT